MGYFGSKAAAGVCEAIISLMPPHRVYIETHVGGGAVLRRKPPADRNIAIDIDAEAIANLKCPYPVEKITGCAHQFLQQQQFVGDELVYCDPPYLLETRSSNKRYRHDYTDEDHESLLAAIVELECSVIISGYPSKLYDAWLYDWNMVELQAMTRGGVRTEKIWFNYEPDRAYWATYAGKNFTDRQRIKRKAATWARRYKGMPPAERLAVLSAIMGVEAQNK